MWGFPDTKGDAQVRAIGPSAVKVITEQPVCPNLRYVFLSEVTEGHLAVMPIARVTLYDPAGR
jgi:hypothetical protein